MTNAYLSDIINAVKHWCCKNRANETFYVSDHGDLCLRVMYWRNKVLLTRTIMLNVNLFEHILRFVLRENKPDEDCLGCDVKLSEAHGTLGIDFAVHKALDELLLEAGDKND